MAHKKSSPKGGSKYCKENHLVRNKIRIITKALKTAGGKMIEVLKSRLEFWRSR